MYSRVQLIRHLDTLTEAFNRSLQTMLCDLGYCWRKEGEKGVWSKMGFLRLTVEVSSPTLKRLNQTSRLVGHTYCLPLLVFWEIALPL